MASASATPAARESRFGKAPFAAAAVALCAWLSMTTPVFAAAARNEVLVSDVSIADATAEQPRDHQDVLIRGDRIVRIAAAGTIRAPGARRIDGHGRYLIPGLWDAHVHLMFLTFAVLPMFVANGITSIRDMGGDLEALKRVRGEIDRGERVGPRMKFCGPMLEGPAVYTDPNHIIVADPDQARMAVAAIAARGPDCIKTRSYPDKATYFAMAEATEKAGLPFVGHAPFSLDPLEALQVRQQTFEHAFYPWPLAKMAPDVKAKVFDRLRANGTMLDPTLVAWEGSRHSFEDLKATVDGIDATTGPARFMSPTLKRNFAYGLTYMKDRGSPGWNRVIDQGAAEIGEMYRAGIPVLVGTDLGSPFVDPDTAVPTELKLLVKGSGLTPREALTAATLTSARMFHQERDLGTVEVGKFADLVLLTANPFQNIENVTRIDTVVLRGRVYDKAARARLRAEVSKSIAAEWAAEAKKPG